MIVKFILLLAALKLHDALDKPIPPALLYVIPLFIVGFFSGVEIVSLFLHTALYGTLALLYFWLLSWFASGAKYYSIMLIGAVILIAI